MNTDHTPGVVPLQVWYSEQSKIITGTNPKRRGRPPKGPNGEKQDRYGVRLYPHEAAAIAGKYGTIHAGLRALVAKELTGIEQK